VRPFLVRADDREQLFGVRSCSLPELAREACQPALVLHVQQEFRGAVRVRGDDHLPGGVGVMVEMRGSLRPAWMTRVHLESASFERDEVIHLVELVNRGAQFLREVEVVRRQLVLALWPQPMLHRPQEMQPVRRGPTPPKYGSSASMPGVPK
jgi:hypothetical protein